ncbi:MAG TPA: hypothetical protein VNE41_09110 [Chitinophagaceae bacterium]|nr:hypothetical protein [Chitinophagaceae bacterium]
MKTYLKWLLTALTTLCVSAVFSQIRVGVGSTTNAAAGVHAAGINNSINNASRASVKTVHHTRTRTMRAVKKTGSRNSAKVNAKTEVRAQSTVHAKSTSGRSGSTFNASRKTSAHKSSTQSHSGVNASRNTSAHKSSTQSHSGKETKDHYPRTTNAGVSVKSDTKGKITTH